MRKRTVALLVMLAVLALTAVSQALFFTVSSVTTDNVITYGNLQMVLHEKDETGTEIPLRGAPALRLNATPTQSVTREITVENTCQEDMYLRMRLSIGGTSADGKTFTLSGEEVKCAANELGGWKAGDDGWYYYEAIVTPGGITAPLLKDNELLFYTKTIAETHSNEPISLSVEVQAVQSAHNPEGETNVFAAQGWPKEVAQP